MMEMLYYTIAGVALYLVSDWLLNRIEIRRGARFENRSLVFFVIILVLAVVSFNLIRHWLPATGPAAPPEAGGTVQETEVPHR